MDVTLNLPTDLAERLRRHASDRGLSIEECIVELLDLHLPRCGEPVRVIGTLESSFDEDDFAQRGRLD